MKKKITLEGGISEFLNFRACCEKFKIRFEHWVRAGGVYIVEAAADQLELIGY